MSEIEKMYENAGVKPTYTDECQMADSYYSMEKDLNERGILFDDYMKQNCPNKNEVCYETCPYAYNKEFYPPFTAEKQIELIKTIETKCDFVDCIQIVYRPMEDLWKISIIPVLEMAFEEMHLYFGCDKDFSTALVMAINNLWQDLTEEEKTSIKNILEM